MASLRPGAASSSNLALRLALRPRIQTSPPQHTVQAIQQTRNVTRKAPKIKKKLSPSFKVYSHKDAEMYTLCDAMRYIRAFEVGRDPVAYKYELHVKLKTLRNGPIIRSRVKLPHPVKTAGRVAVIVDPKSKEGLAVKKAGADIIGEEEIFEAVRAGKIDFNRILCHTNSVAKLNAAQVGRILGPRGLMPSVKLETISDNVASMVDSMKGSSEYRERTGVIRLGIGQLAFTPEQLSQNVKFVMESIKSDCAAMSDTFTKSVYEVVLSSTNSPGFILNGQLHQPHLDKPEATAPQELPRLQWIDFDLASQQEIAE